MLIQYDGPHPEIVVDELDQDTVIYAGKPVEIPNDLAARLLEQSTWSKANAALAPAVVPNAPTVISAGTPTTDTKVSS